jgi:hypothetical protein
MTDPSKPFAFSALPMPLPPWWMPFSQSYEQDRDDFVIDALDEALSIAEEVMELVAMLDPDRTDQESPQEASRNERQAKQ